MKRQSLICLSVLIPLVFTVFLLSCEKNYITQAPDEHIPEYHMTYNCVMPIYGGPGYVITINTNTHEVIDSINYENLPLRDLCFIDGGNKILIAGYPNTFIEDVVSHDTVTLINRYFYNLYPSSNGRYCAATEDMIYILSLPDLNVVDSVDNGEGGSLVPIGIDDEKKILYAYLQNSSLVYKIDFSVNPSETTIVDIASWRPNPNRKIIGSLSPDNRTLLLNSEEAYESYTLFEYSTESMSFVDEIPGQRLIAPTWTSDGQICYGSYGGSVVKYNIQTKIFSTVIDRRSTFSPDVNYYLGDGFYALDIHLTPDDKWLYIQLPPYCGGPCIGFGGHTLVYDIEKGDIVYRYDYSEYSEIKYGLMRINPKDWSN